MSYSQVIVKLTPGQLKILQSKHAVSCGTTITLKHDQLTGGSNKISLTKTQLNHLSKAKEAKKGIRIDFSVAAIKDMTKTGGIFPLLAAIPALIAAAAPIVAKAGALGAFWNGTEKRQPERESYTRNVEKKGKHEHKNQQDVQQK